MMRGTTATKLIPCSAEEYKSYVQSIASEIKEEYEDTPKEDMSELVTDCVRCIFDSETDPQLKKVSTYLTSKGYRTHEQKVYKVASDVYARV